MMKQGIIITTHDSTMPFYIDLIRSLEGCPYPIVTKKNTVMDNGWEIGGLKLGSFLFDEFLYLHDTILIKNPSFIVDVFEREKHRSVSLFPKFNAYLGKYQSIHVRACELPDITTKAEAVHWETEFSKEYLKLCGPIVTMFPEIDAWRTSGVYREKHGRKNCVYENDSIVKYKGTWNRSMIK